MATLHTILAAHQVTVAYQGTLALQVGAAQAVLSQQPPVAACIAYACWNGGGLPGGQGMCVHLGRLDSGLLADAVQRKVRVCAHGVIGDSIAPTLSRSFGLERLSSVLWQPIVDVRNGVGRGVLVAAEKGVGQAPNLLFNEPIFDANDECVPGLTTLCLLILVRMVRSGGSRTRHCQAEVVYVHPGIMLTTLPLASLQN